ncbi:MAG: hypothetical protein QM754_17500 [Tepidisphaeraceae bacterium]
MSQTIRATIESEIKSLTTQLAKLSKLMTMLDGKEGRREPARVAGQDRGQKRAEPKPKAARQLRLLDDTRVSISEKIVKAAKAHKDGASKADIIKYLDTSGYRLGTNYNELHLFAILNTLRDGEKPQITTTGEKAKMRYHAA